MSDSAPATAAVAFYPRFFARARTALAALRAQETDLLQRLPDAPPHVREQHARTGHLLGLDDEDAWVAIVFGGMGVEALIYDCAARNFGEETFRDEFGALTVAERWAELVRRLSGAPADAGLAGRVARVARARNRLVHFQTVVFDLTDRAAFQREFDRRLREYDFRKQAEDAVETAGAVVAALRALGQDVMD